MEKAITEEGEPLSPVVTRRNLQSVPVNRNGHCELTTKLYYQLSEGSLEFGVKEEGKCEIPSLLSLSLSLSLCVCVCLCVSRSLSVRM